MIGAFRRLVLGARRANIARPLPEGEGRKGATMTTSTTSHLRTLGGVALIAALTTTVGLAQERPSLRTEADFLRAMEELSNWGRWGADDGLGAANFITPAKRKSAAALVTEGLSISLAHDVIQEDAVDGGTYLDRQVLRVSDTGAADQYQYTGTYHGAIRSHLDSVACHVMFEGKGYNGVSQEAIQTAGGCPQGSIHELRDGIMTRGILFDATLLPGRATPEGWLEPGEAITWADLEQLEEIQGVRVSEGDVREPPVG